MGKILGLLIGGITLVVGLILLIAWWYEFLFMLRSVVPALLIFGGAVAVMSGLSEYRDIFKKKV